MPMIEISQQAYDGLKREVERWYDGVPLDQQTRPAPTIGELASDALRNYAANLADDPGDPDAPSIPF